MVEVGVWVVATDGVLVTGGVVVVAGLVVVTGGCEVVGLAVTVVDPEVWAQPVSTKAARSAMARGISR